MGKVNAFACVEKIIIYHTDKFIWNICYVYMKINLKRVQINQYGFINLFN